MSAFLHRLAHRFGYNRGRIVTWHDLRGRCMIGHRCECGKLTGVHPMPRFVVFV